MKPPPLQIVRARTVDAALEALAEHGDEAKVLAGGQSLVPLLNMRFARPTALVDVNGIPGFIEDRFEDDVRNKVAAILRDKIQSIVPPLASEFLDGFVSKTYEVNLLGQTIQFSFWPSAMLTATRRKPPSPPARIGV